MKPSLQLKLSQHLTLTPQLQQSIKLLQLSTIELNQEIERILFENPMLEREDGDGADFAPQPPTAPPGKERRPPRTPGKQATATCVRGSRKERLDHGGRVGIGIRSRGVNRSRLRRRRRAFRRGRRLGIHPTGPEHGPAGLRRGTNRQ